MEKSITIIFSGMAGSGKTSLAKAIARKYGLEYFCGGDALKEIAVRKGYRFSGEDWWETGEGMKFLAERKNNEEFDKEVDKIMIKTAENGSVAMTSWTLPWLDAPGIKIWVSASQETRAERIVKRDKISYEKALELVKKRDVKNIELYKKLYGFALEKDLDVFDLILDTDNKSVDELVKEVAEFVEK